MFARPSARNTHLRSHSNEAPYPCPNTACGYHFSVQSNMRRHVKAGNHVHLSGGITSPEGDLPSPSPSVAR